MGKTRVIAFIDGFNLYHSLRHLDGGQYKWLNLTSLAEAFIIPQKEELVKIYYFTAYAYWLPHAQKRHKVFVEANKCVNGSLEVVLGKFKEKDRICKKCGKSYTSHEEKATDVNISLYIFIEAYKDNYDKALIITADTDIIPAIELTTLHFPEKELHVILPFSRHGKIFDEYAHDVKRIRRHHLKRNQLPEKIEDESGKIYSRPPEWNKR